MAERAARTTLRSARPAGEGQFQHSRLAGIGEETKRLHGWAEERDHWRSHPRCHVHYAGIPRHECPGALEQCSGSLESEDPRRARYPSLPPVR